MCVPLNHHALGIMPLTRFNTYGIMSLTRFPAHGRMSLSQCALPSANDVLPCAGKHVNDIMPWMLPHANDMSCAQCDVNKLKCVFFYCDILLWGDAIFMFVVRMMVELFYCHFSPVLPLFKIRYPEINSENSWNFTKYPEILHNFQVFYINCIWCY